MSEALCIDCDTCVMKATPACDECVVTFVCGRDLGEAVIIDADEARTVRMLMRTGLLPRSRHVPLDGRGSAHAG